MKKLLTRLVILVPLLALLVGCRSADRQRPNTIEAESTITVAGFPAFQQAYENLAQQFQELHPTINVQYVVLDQQTGSLSLAERASIADVLLLPGRPVSEAATLFLDLTPLAATTENLDANDFWPGLLEACQANGIQIGLPLSVNVDLIFFDETAFDAAGVVYPRPGWDWQTFQQTAEFLTQRAGTAVNRYGFVDTGRHLSLLGPLVDSTVVAGDNSLDSGRLAAELDWYVNFARAGVMPIPNNDPQMAINDRNDLIRSRRAAMWIGGQFELNQWQSTFGESLGVVSFPTNGAASSNPARPTCAAISAGTAEPEAAWLWLHFLSTQTAAGFQSDVPAKPSVAQSSGYWEGFEDGTAAALRYALEHGWYGSNAVPETTAINDALIEAVAGEGALSDKLPTSIDIQPTAAPSTPDSTPIAVATPRTTPTPAALPSSSIPTENVIVVDYYIQDSYYRSREAIEALARAFNEAQHGIEVRLGTTFGGAYITDVADNYDCFAWSGWANSYAASMAEFTSKLYSLTPLLAAEDAAFFDDFDSAQLEWNQVEGELFALPVAIRPHVIQYNADLLASLGLQPPSPNWTVDEFWALAEAATATGNERGRKIYGFVPAILMPENLPLLAPAAKYPYDPYVSPPVATFTDPAVVQGLTWLASMVEAGTMFPIDWGGTRTSDNPMYGSLQIQRQSGLILREEAAMWTALAGTDGYHFATGVAPFPQTTLPQRPSQTPDLMSLYMSRRAANPLGCWEWFKFLSAQPDAFPGVPVRRSVRESQGWEASVGYETASAYRESLSRPTQPLPDLEDPYFGTAFPYTLWWSDALQEVFSR